MSLQGIFCEYWRTKLENNLLCKPHQVQFTCLNYGLNSILKRSSSHLVKNTPPAFNKPRKLFYLSATGRKQARSQLGEALFNIIVYLYHSIGGEFQLVKLISQNTTKGYLLFHFTNLTLVIGLNQQERNYSL